MVGDGHGTAIPPHRPTVAHAPVARRWHGWAGVVGWRVLDDHTSQFFSVHFSFAHPDGAQSDLRRSDAPVSDLHWE
jgi:hypothetical protein